MSWCPDGTRLATAGTDGEVKIWDPDTGDELISLAGSWVAWSPDGHRLAAIGDPNGAIMIWDASAGYQLAGSPEFRAAIHYDRAINHWRNGALDAALAEFEEVIRINPNSAKAYDRRAGLYLKRGEIDKAIADYDELIRLDPKAASNYQARARLLLDKGEFDRAAADLSNAISLSPSSEWTVGLFSPRRGWLPDSQRSTARRARRCSIVFARPNRQGSLILSPMLAHLHRRG